VEVGVYDGTVPTERHPTAEPAPAGSLIDLRRVARRYRMGRDDPRHQAGGASAGSRSRRCGFSERVSATARRSP
jgi:hypothetical protein